MTAFSVPSVGTACLPTAHTCLFNRRHIQKSPSGGCLVGRRRRSDVDTGETAGWRWSAIVNVREGGRAVDVGRWLDRLPYQSDPGLDIINHQIPMLASTTSVARGHSMEEATPPILRRPSSLSSLLRPLFNWPRATTHLRSQYLRSSFPVSFRHVVDVALFPPSTRFHVECQHLTPHPHPWGPRYPIRLAPQTGLRPTHPPIIHHPFGNRRCAALSPLSRYRFTVLSCHKCTSLQSSLAVCQPGNPTLPDFACVTRQLQPTRTMNPAVTLKRVNLF